MTLTFYDKSGNQTNDDVDYRRLQLLSPTLLRTSQDHMCRNKTQLEGSIINLAVIFYKV